MTPGLRLAARAPNHLGDGVLALPALTALSQRFELEIYAPRWGPELYGGLPARVRARGTMAEADVAVLFAPSFGAAWQARRVPVRVGAPGDWRGLLLNRRVRASGHRLARYAALAAAVGARAEGEPRWLGQAEPSGVPVGHVGLAPLSSAGGSREWGGFRALAHRVQAELGLPVVWYGGPGERARLATVAAGPGPRVLGSLAQVSGALQGCALFVGNDSGLAHFARAVGAPALVLYGPTRPWESGPLGARVLDPGSAAGLAALGVDAVLDVVREALR